MTLAEIAWAPEQASTLAIQVDRLFAVLLAICLFMLLLLTALVVGFAWHYRRRPHAERVVVGEDKGKEIWWTGGLLAAFLGLFAWGAGLYLRQAQTPADALEIRALGKQWMWQFQHPGGRKEINELHVPLARPVRVILTTQDVIHSFYVPAFRIKQDAVPGRYTATWFEATRAGRYHLFCAEYCGLDHARMTGQVVVMSPSDYEDWLTGGTTGAQEEGLFARYGCLGCHGEAAGGIAPSLAGIFGHRVTLRDGTAVLADEAYLRESILSPEKRVVAGFEPIMPSFAGRLSDAELESLVLYVKSLPAKGGSP